MDGLDAGSGAGYNGANPPPNLPLGKNRIFVTTKTPKKRRQLGQFSKQDASPRFTVEEAKKRKAAKSGHYRNLRYWLSMRQRQEIIRAGMYQDFKSLCGCGRYPIPATVKTKDGRTVKTGSPGKIQLNWYKPEDGSDHPPLAFAWARHCASPMLCFLDAPVIHWHRSQEVQKICEKMVLDGYAVQFWTFTAPHDLHTDPIKQREAFQKAIRRLRQGRMWTLFVKKYCVEHHIRAVEMTDDAPNSGQKSGCHFHFHFIVFCRHKPFTEAEADEMRRFISLRWVRFLVEEGLIEDSVEKQMDALKYGFRLDLPRKPKQKKKTIEELASYIAKGASCEMTPGIFMKNGRMPMRISHWELMALALIKYPEAIPRMLAVMRALQGVHWLQFSPGLREMCKVEKVSDEEILKKKNAPCVRDFTQDEWNLIDDVKYQRRVIESIVDQCKSAGYDISDLDVVGKHLDDEDRRVQDLRWVVIYTIDQIKYGCDPDTGELLEDAVAHPPKLE